MDWVLPYVKKLKPRSRLHLRPQYKALAVDREGLFLISDRDCQVLEGQVFVDLLPFLRDGCDEEAIADALERTYERPLVHYAIGLLKERSLLTDKPRNGVLSEAAFWDELGFDSQTVSERLQAISIEVTSVGKVDPTILVKTLNSVGISAHVADRCYDESLKIVITDDYLSAELAKLAVVYFRENRPWLLARAAGTELWIGPFFEQRGPCLECLTWRIRTNRIVEDYLWRRLGRNVGTSQSIAQVQLLNGLVAHIIVLETAKWVAGSRNQEPHVKTIDLKNLHTEEHPLRPRPQCKVCGNPQLQSEIMTRPITVTDDEKPTWTSLDDITHFVSRVTGIVSNLIPAPTGLSSLYSYSGVFGFGRDAQDFEALKKSFLSQAAGVGTSIEEAKVGAICEALERYSGMYHGDEPAIQASYAQLNASTTIHPNECMLYSARQYEMRKEINAKGAAFDLVPEPFRETDVLDWTGVWSLTEARFKLLPSAYLFYNYPRQRGGAYCWADSNGCAAGKTLTDALGRGLFELIERDGVAIWWYNRLRRPKVDLSSFGLEYFNSFIGWYESLGREAWVLDITSDLGIPTFVAISRSISEDTEDILVSFGAHLDARVAIEHALCEMNHLLPAVLPQNRTSSGDYPYPDRSQKRWWRSATIVSEPYLLPDPNLVSMTAAQYGPFPSMSEAELADTVCNRLQESGMEVLALNQTRPDVNIPVAKVIVPGLRHFWARFAAGRLYDVPVSLGWVDRPRLEKDLNPIAMFV